MSSENRWLSCPKCKEWGSWQLWTEYTVTRTVKYRRSVYVFIGDGQWNHSELEEDSQLNQSRWRTSQASKVKVTFDRDYSETENEEGGTKDQEAIKLRCSSCGWEADEEFVAQVLLVDAT